MSIRRWGTISSIPGTSFIPEILKSLDLLVKPAGGAAIASGSPGIVPGSFLYQITAAGASQYYWLPSKVSKVDSGLGTPTTTSFYVRNPAFLPGDTITVGAAAATVATVDPNTGLVTTTAAITLPTNGMRVFSQTAGQNAVKAVALDYAPSLTSGDQAIEIAIAGVFKKDIMDLFYDPTDITAWGAVAIPEVNAYRWS
jgi:hypothetical protein